MAPYDQGYTCYNGAYKRSDLARASGPHKKCVVVRIESQLDSMKSESLVIVDQNATVNTFGPCTPPVTPWEWVAKEVGSLTFGRGLPLCDS